MIYKIDNHSYSNEVSVEIIKYDSELLVELLLKVVGSDSLLIDQPILELSAGPTKGMLTVDVTWYTLSNNFSNWIKCLWKLTTPKRLSRGMLNLCLK
jgi:hypothetical protein